MSQSLFRGGFIAVAAIVLAVQLVPYGRDHTNPTGQAEPQWNTPQTRELAVKACFDCHSNATVWPWYSNIAPASWLIQSDVERGRRRLNFSAWNAARRGEGDAGETVQRNKMPPSYYVVMHPSAGLSAQEKQSLIQGFQSSLGTGGSPSRPGGG